MKRIGLFTSKYNYGSLLQSYATKKAINGLGFECEYIIIVDNYKHLFKRAINFVKKIFKLYKKSQFIFSEYYYNNPSFLFEKKCFLDVELKEKYYSKKILKNLIKDGYFQNFIIGSDQVWNFKNNKHVNKDSFLSFAPKFMRNSFASSFGSESINKNHIFQYKRLLNKMNNISVRENSGKVIINSLIKKDVTLLSDPVILLKADEWREFYNLKAKANFSNYILIHFLGQPSKIAIDSIKMFNKKYNLPFIIFLGNPNDFTFIENKVIYDGSPYDYLKLIDNSFATITDSFHTSQLAIVFNKPFFVFDRLYQKGAAKQSTRIDELISKFNCSNSYIDNANKQLIVKECDYNDLLDYYRKMSISYLEKVIGKNEIKIELKDKYECTNCKICQLICSKGAIKFKSYNKFFKYPVIDFKMCANCNLCKNVCNSIIKQIEFKKQGFISFSNDLNLRKSASSGGTFASIAANFINDGGIVFGAKLIIDGKNSCCICEKAENLTELKPLLNSKYVECDCSKSFSLIKEYLEKGRKVLFASTSCHVESLYKYLGKSYDNLFTVDLFCHGTPPNVLFGKYIEYLEKKYNGKIISYSFRKKSNNEIWKWTDNHKEIIVVKKKNKVHTYENPFEESLYYSLFLNGEIYKDCCYTCKFASLHKPADITIGDYYELENDYPDILEKYPDIIKKGVNSGFINTKKGKELLKKSDLTIIDASVDLIQKSHNALCKPSNYSNSRRKSLKIIKNYGFYTLQSRINKNKKISKLANRIRNLIK